MVLIPLLLNSVVKRQALVSIVLTAVLAALIDLKSVGLRRFFYTFFLYFLLCNVILYSAFYSKLN